MITGETAGFVVPGLAWLMAWRVGFPPLATAAAVVPSGACEGAILGFAQWSVLRRWQPGFSCAWVWATAVGAGLAWAAGMTPSTAHDLGARTWLAISLGVGLSPFVLVALPVAQWAVLRRHADRAWRWIPWSVAAWAAALPPTFIIPALLPSGATVAQVAAAWVIAGLAMAAILALITGYGMSKIFAPQSKVRNPKSEIARGPG